LFNLGGITGASADVWLVLMVGNAVNDIWSMLLTGPADSAALRQETFGSDNKLAMSVAANGSRLAYSGVFEVGHLEIGLFDPLTRDLVAIPLAGGNLVSKIGLSPDGSRLGYREFAGGKLVSRMVSVRNPAPADPFCGGCSFAGFFSRSEALLVAYGSKLVRQDLATGIQTTLIEGPVSDPALSPDDRWLAFVHPSQTVQSAFSQLPWERDRPLPKSGYRRTRTEMSSHLRSGPQMAANSTTSPRAILSHVSGHGVSMPVRGNSVSRFTSTTTMPLLR
jgi:hypothetical protein